MICAWPKINPKKSNDFFTLCPDIPAEIVRSRHPKGKIVIPNVNFGINKKGHALA